MVSHDPHADPDMLRRREYEAPRIESITPVKDAMLSGVVSLREAEERPPPQRTWRNRA